MGDDIVKAVLNFLEGGEMEEVVNFTHIALILKIQDLVTVHDFRLISLCNILYKIIAKTLVNRMKLVLGKVIANNQSAFLHGRLNLDDIILAYETLHYMKIRKYGKMRWMAIKVGMLKAYNRVEWSGFPEGNDG